MPANRFRYELRWLIYMMKDIEFRVLIVKIVKGLLGHYAWSLELPPKHGTLKAGAT
jgi:hypothetical protein